MQVQVPHDSFLLQNLSEELPSVESMEKAKFNPWLKRKATRFDFCSDVSANIP